MLDVHVLTHEGTEPWRLERCLASLRGEPCNVHVIDNRGAPVGLGRKRGYSEGSAPFVSYLDSDDELVPGTFDRLLEELRYHRSVVTLERVVTEATGYACPLPKRNHAVVGFRRSDIEALAPRLNDAPWCADILVREALGPTQLDWVGVINYFRPGTARQRVTQDQIRSERQVCLTQTKPR